RAAVDNRDRGLYDLLGARFLITDADAEPPGASFRRVHETDDGLVIWENEDAMPRVWLAYTAEQVDSETALAATRQADFDPRETLYLPGELPPAEPGGQGQAMIERIEANRVHVRVQTDRPAYVVLADPDYPGWVATVDGEPAESATAYGLFRAVTVPAGEHEVVWRFQPPLACAGAVVSLLALLGVGAMALLGWRQRRRVPGAPQG